MKKLILRILIFLSVFGGGSIATYHSGLFSHTDDRDISHIRINIDPGHGPIFNGEYLTPGKHSPKWQDSTKLYEGHSIRDIAYRLYVELLNLQLDAEIIAPELEDVSLRERVIRNNARYYKDKRTIYLSCHHNAQANNGTADYIDNEGYHGWTSTSTGGASHIIVFTSVGYTKSDIIADYIAKELKLLFDIPVYTREANFYVLKYTHSPAVLLEFGFMTTYDPDYLIMTNPVQRQKFIIGVARGLKNYNNYLNNIVL
jgi:N-acetylmuramoyl-L-alanine amidase